MPDQGNQRRSASDRDAQEQAGEQTLFIGAKRALAGGVLAAGVALGGQWFVGQIYSGAEALKLVSALVPAARSVGSSVVTASGTILALMLTMLSLTSQANSNFDRVFYHRVQRIGLLSTIALAAGILLLLFLSIPVQESDAVPGSWFGFVYYLLIVLTAGLAGLLVAIVLMLFNAMTSLIQVLSPTKPAKKTTDDS
jgi:hypothetical protein